RRGCHTALCATAWAIVGTVAGGALMYRWGMQDPASAAALLDRLPAIAAAMIAGGDADLRGAGLPAMALGAFSGVPYKIYAVMAPGSGIGPGVLLAASVPIRGRALRRCCPCRRRAEQAARGAADVASPPCDPRNRVAAFLWSLLCADAELRVRDAPLRQGTPQSFPDPFAPAPIRRRKRHRRRARRRCARPRSGSPA